MAVIDTVTYFDKAVIDAVTYFDEEVIDEITYFDEAVIDSAVEPRVPVPRLLGKHDGVLGTVLGQGDQPQRRPELGRIVVDVQHRDVDLSVA